MKTFCSVLFCAALFTTGLNTGAKAQSVEIKACMDATVNLRTVPIGYQCKTSAGAIFTRVQKDGFGESWRGPDGLVWGDLVPNGNYTQPDGLDICQNFGGALPSKRDFLRGKQYVFRDALPHMRTSEKEREYIYWTTDVYGSGTLDHPKNAFVFYGNDYHDWYGEIYFNISGGESVRCVGH